MRRTQLLNKSKAEVSNSVACMCADVSGIVAANEVRLRSAEVNMKFVGAASSVASIVKHKIQNVCTWKKSNLKEIHSEGSKLFSDRAFPKMVEAYGDVHCSLWINGQLVANTPFSTKCAK